MSRLLVVDDNEQNRYLLQALLSGYGHETILANEGAEALEKARANPPDLIVTDILMPGMDGYTLCHHWQRDEELRKIPLIFYTATYTDPKDEELALSLGAARFILKPQEPRVLMETIAEVLDAHKAGLLAPARDTLIEDTVYFKEYNEALIRKLEDKLLELESAKAVLEREAVERIQTEAELERINRSLVMISECNQALVRSTNEADLLNEICRLLIQLGGYPLAWIGYAEDDAKKTVRPVAWMGDDDYIAHLDVTWADEERGRDPVGTSIREQRLVFVQNVAANDSFLPWRAAAQKCGYGSVISFPLLLDGQAFGALTIYASSIDAFNEHEIRLLDELAGDLAYGITSLRTRDKHRQAMREIEVLAKFPSENPNPVMRIAPNGDLLYTNASNAPILAAWKWDAGQPAPEDWRERIATAFHTGKASEFECVYADRSYVFALAPIPEAGYVNVYGRDITARTRAVENLRASEDKFRSIFENMAVACSFDEIVYENGVAMDYRILDVNPSYERLIGISREAAVGSLASQLFGEGRIPFFEIYARVAETGEPAFFEEYFPLIKKHLDVIVSSPRKGLFSTLFSDITGRLENERRLRHAQKMEAIGTLAGGIAHDFNNILTAILGYSEIVQGDLPADGHSRKDIEHVIKGAHRAKDLVHQILTFSRQTEEKPHPLRPQLVVKEALKLLRPSLPATIEIVEEIEAQTGRVMADPTLIHQVMMNLCTNAYQAMRDTAGELRVGLRNVAVDTAMARRLHLPREGSYVLLTVADTGEGIAPENLERIFEPFFTTKADSDGTGLGLATVHGIVTKMDGTIQVTSEKGKGTTFEVYLPCIEDTPMEISQEEEEAPGGTERILLVDDELEVREMWETALSRLGYKVTSLNRAQKALDRFSAHPDAFDVLITDFTMPQMTGLELIARIKAIRPELPVILNTGYAERIDEEAPGASVVDRYILKPSSRLEMAKAIREVLAR